MPRLPHSLPDVSLTQWMLASLAAGAGTRWLAPDFSGQLGWISDVFLRLIRSAVAPLLAGVLLGAVGRAGRARSLGRLGLLSLLYFEIATTTALLLGWFAALWFQPGAGAGLGQIAPAAPAAPLRTLMAQIFPESVLDALARNDVLQTVVFCLLAGLAASGAGAKAGPLLDFADALGRISFQYVRLVMYLAPAGIFAAMASSLAARGATPLAGLGRFIALAWAAQLIFGAGFLGGALRLARVPLREFAAAVREPFLVAFATTSSAAALPQAFVALERMGVPARVTGFVLPLSLSLNLCGSTIHLAMAALFVAQAAGIQFGWREQAMILLTLKITSKGVAGVPRANFIILSGLFASFGLPAEGLTLLLAVDAVIDMIRTGVNILSHCTAAAALARWAGPGGESQR